MEYIERETGQFPLSIGTSLALEGLFQIHPNQPPIPTAGRRVNALWVNLRTLIRNFYASMKADQQRSAPVSQAVDLLVEEIRSLQDIVQQQGKGRYQLVIYHNDLSEVRWQFPHAHYKEPKTEKQIYQAHLEATVLKLVLDQVIEEKLPVANVVKQPPTTPQVAALLTHYPHELLWRFQFDSLFLLESHTGKLKGYSQWCSKLNGLTVDHHIPFNAFTLQLFGEGVLFSSFPKKLLDEVKQLAGSRKWSAVTTIEKIRDDVSRYGGEVLRQTYATLMSR
jgi:hypothetical protein